jgi:hypothetical protein
MNNQNIKQYKKNQIQDESSISIIPLLWNYNKENYWEYILPLKGIRGMTRLTSLIYISPQELGS